MTDNRGPGRPPGSKNRIPDPRPMILRSIPGDLKREFHLACVREGISMTQKIIALMRAYLKEVEK